MRGENGVGNVGVEGVPASKEAQIFVRPPSNFQSFALTSAKWKKILQHNHQHLTPKFMHSPWKSGLRTYVGHNYRLCFLQYDQRLENSPQKTIKANEVRGISQTSLDPLLSSGVWARD